MSEDSMTTTGKHRFLRVTTDATLYGEAETDYCTQQHLGVKGKSQCFQGSQIPQPINVPRQTHAHNVVEGE